jgi:3-hydroxy-3-methylglutaryl CoA synthase
VNEPVGIDDLNVYGSTLSVEFAAIATARARPARELDAVGFERRSITPPYEDPVTLAVNAAWPLVEELGPAAFELLIVATESGLDFGKPLSSYVHRYLGLAPRCRNLEVKHACYGGTAAVQLAAAWVRSGEVPGGRALVVMTDTARRHFGDPAELTAGSGAVAVTVTARPRVLEIEPGSGYASREVYDVARPTFIDEWGDPVLSLAAYFDLVEEAWAGYQRARTDAATRPDAATNGDEPRDEPRSVPVPALPHAARGSGPPGSLRSCSRPVSPAPATAATAASSRWCALPSATPGNWATSTRAASTACWRGSWTECPT